MRGGHFARGLGHEGTSLTVINEACAFHWESEEHGRNPLIFWLRSVAEMALQRVVTAKRQVPDALNSGQVP